MPFRWVCTSGKEEDLEVTDRLAAEVLEQMLKESPAEIQGQMEDNLHWIREAKQNRLVVGSQARILYADSEGRTRIALAFNEAIKRGEVTESIIAPPLGTCLKSFSISNSVSSPSIGIVRPKQ